MKTGIVGLPCCGKTTLFCALTGTDYQSLSHRAVEIHIGCVPIPDERLDSLESIFHSRKVTYATMEYLDAAGMKRNGVVKKDVDSGMLRSLREADCLLHVINAFAGSGYRPGDYEELENEMRLVDLVIIESRLTRLEKEMRSKRDDYLIEEHNLLERMKEALENDHSLRELDFSDEEKKLLRGFQFLSYKPELLFLNMSEEMIGEVGEKAAAHLSENSGLICLSADAELEMEIAQMDEGDRDEYLREMGIGKSALSRLIQKTIECLGLVTFYTGNERELHTWLVPAGTTALKAAGVIHSDMERGFIRAETIFCEDLLHCGSIKAAREEGLLRVEGKDYIVRDGDVLQIRFNV